MREELTGKQLEDVAEQLRRAEQGCPDLEAWVGWLKGAFFSHSSAVQCLRARLNAVRGLALSWAPPGHKLTVEEARMLNVCRLCHLAPLPTPEGGPFVLKYGEEFAHQKCLEKEKA